MIKYLIILYIFVITLLSYSLKNNNKKIYYFIISLTLAVVAYNIFPNNNLDLKYWFEYLDIFRYYSFNMLTNSDIFQRVPVFAIYIFIISKTSYFHLMPTILIFLQYFLILCSVNDYSKKNNINCFAEVSVILSFLMIKNYVNAVSGMRFSFSTTVFVYFLYKDLIKKEGLIKQLPFYLLLCLMHNAVIILLIIRVLLFFYKKNTFNKILINSVLLSWTFFKAFLIDILSKSSLRMFTITSYKLEAYDNELMSSIANVKLYSFVSMTLLSILFLIYLRFREKKYKTIESINNYYISYIEMLFFFIVGSVYEYNIFVRFTEVLFILFIYFLACYFQLETKGISLKRINLMYLFVMIESILYLIFYLVGQLNLIFF